MSRIRNCKAILADLPGSELTHEEQVSRFQELSLQYEVKSARLEKYLRILESLKERMDVAGPPAGDVDAMDES